MAQVKANGITLEVEVDGPPDAPAIIIINGFISQLVSWPPEFHEGFIKNGFRTVRFDNRDTGLSHKFAGNIPDLMKVMMAATQGKRPEAPYSLDDMADDAAGVLDALGIESAHVIGASMGGMIAQLFAIRHPQKCRSLISLMTTTGDPSLAPPEPQVQSALMARPINESKEAAVEAQIGMIKAFGTPQYHEDEDWLRNHFAKQYERSYYPEGAIRHWTALLSAQPRTEALKKLTGVPTLVVHGTADVVTKPDAAIHTHECIKGSELVWIEGLSHDLCRSLMPTLHAKVGPFMRRVERERAEREPQHKAVAAAAPRAKRAKK